MEIRKMMNENCMVCQRIEITKRGENPYFVKELETEIFGHLKAKVQYMMC